jgi:hypothetical protein
MGPLSGIHNYLCELLQCIQYFVAHKIQKQKTNSVAFSPQANYTDLATTTCQQIFSANFCGERVVGTQDTHV